MYQNVEPSIWSVRAGRANLSVRRKPCGAIHIAFVFHAVVYVHGDFAPDSARVAIELLRTLNGIIYSGVIAAGRPEEPFGNDFSH